MRPLIALSLIVLAAASVAQPVQLDPGAAALAAKATAAYKALKTYRMKAVGNGGSPEFASIPTAMEVRFRRPNQVFVSVAEKAKLNDRLVKRATAWDGRVLQELDASSGRIRSETYSKPEMPESVSLTALECEPLFFGRSIVPEGSFPGAKASVAPAEEYHGTKVDVLRLEASIPESQAQFRMELLIAQGDSLLRGVRFKLSGNHPTTGKPIGGDFELRYTLVETNPSFKPSDFRLAPAPSGQRTKPKK